MPSFRAIDGAALTTAARSIQGNFGNFFLTRRPVMAAAARRGEALATTRRGAEWRCDRPLPARQSPSPKPRSRTSASSTLPKEGEVSWVDANAPNRSKHTPRRKPTLPSLRRAAEQLATMRGGAVGRHDRQLPARQSPLRSLVPRLRRPSPKEGEVSWVDANAQGG